MIPEIFSFLNFFPSFEVACIKFSLTDHLNGIVPAHPNDPIWAVADDYIHAWLYNSVVEDGINFTIVEDGLYMAYILLYMDEITLMASSPALQYIT